MKVKLKDLLTKNTLDIIVARDEELVKKLIPMQRFTFRNLVFTNLFRDKVGEDVYGQTMEEARTYAQLAGYCSSMESLKKANPRTYASLQKEIERRKGDAVVDLSLLEKVAPDPLRIIQDPMSMYFQ